MLLEKAGCHPVSGRLSARKGSVVDDPAAAGRAALLQNGVPASIQLCDLKRFLPALFEILCHILALPVHHLDTPAVSPAFRRLSGGLHPSHLLRTDRDQFILPKQLQYLVTTAVLSVVNLILLVALFFRKEKPAPKEDDRLNDVRNAALINSIDRAFTAQNRRIDDMTAHLSAAVRDLAAQNEKSLREMRYTVDEKLSATLEQRLEGSYRIIADNLNKVALGIGEVNKLADSVSDIKKIFTNVKVRGTWGEIQLENLLADMLAPEQFVRNCRLNAAVDSFVDFAVVLPDKNGNRTYLPIDSKFPVEEYARLMGAASEEDARAAEKGLFAAVKRQADSIAAKYVCPPVTTDFAIMYLPVEGLFAETVKNADLTAYLHGKRIMVCGPTNLYALLNSLQVGFKTVTIEKRSRELWRLLSAFKSEFLKFSLLLEKTGKKLQEAQDSIDLASKKTRTIERRLKDVAEIEGEAPAPDWDDGEL